MGLYGQLDTDWVARADDAAGQNNAHDPGFANEPVVGTALEHSRHETQTELVELRARIAKARQAKNRGRSTCSSVSTGNARSSRPWVVMFSPSSPGRTPY